MWHSNLVFLKNGIEYVGKVNQDTYYMSAAIPTRCLSARYPTVPLHQQARDVISNIIISHDLHFFMSILGVMLNVQKNLFNC